MPERDPDQMRRVNANLRALRDGTIRRQLEEERDRKAAIKQVIKKAKQRHKSVVRRIKTIEVERAGLQSYLDELLLREDPGPVDECDAAIEGCTAELGDLRDEEQTLMRIIKS